MSVSSQLVSSQCKSKACPLKWWECNCVFVSASICTCNRSGQKSKIEQINMTLVLKSFFVPASSPKNLLCVCVCVSCYWKKSIDLHIFHLPFFAVSTVCAHQHIWAQKKLHFIFLWKSLKYGASLLSARAEHRLIPGRQSVNLWNVRKGNTDK